VMGEVDDMVQDIGPIRGGGATNSLPQWSPVVTAATLAGRYSIGT
jgi:hypothetical protein